MRTSRGRFLLGASQSVCTRFYTRKMKTLPTILSSLALAVLLHINSHKQADARPSEVNGRISISEINTNLDQRDKHLQLQKRESDYDYDGELESMYDDDYDLESDYWDSEESLNPDEVVHAEASIESQDLPLAELTSNRTLNLRAPSRDAPEYMMELYERFSKNKWVHPKSNIVRSFQNINEEVFSPLVGDEPLRGMKTRVHTLVFNITSIPSDENIDLAKIRLYKLVTKDRRTYVGVDRKVSVFEVFDDKPGSDQSMHRLISSKHIYGHTSGWESFDVTSAVRRWVLVVNSVQILEVRIETVFNQKEPGDMDIDTRHENKRDPLLVVFSSETEATRQHARELQELISHESDLNTISPSEMFDLGEGKAPLKLSSRNHMSDNINLNRYSSDDSHVLHRVKRAKRNRKSRKNNNCRRKPMYVNFAEINWNDWIIAPRGYQAFECTGRCHFPLNDHLTPTKHAIIQALMHIKDSKKASRACCVPTKLAPMSMLYIDKGNAVFKYKYDDMIVAKCGCR